MRKSLILFILTTYLIANLHLLSLLSFADWQVNLDLANNEITTDKDFKVIPKKYSDKDINTYVANNEWGGLKTGSTKFSKEIGHAFTYGEPYGFDSIKTPPWRYIGKTFDGDNFTNIYFPHDAWAGGYLEDRSWILNPWNENLCIKSNFDTPNLYNPQKYRQQIIIGLEMFYGDVLKGTYINFPWENYVHILQPPTFSSQGIGKMWHISGGKTWYMTVPIAKFELAPTPIPTATPMPTNSPTPIPTATPLPIVDYKILYNNLDYTDSNITIDISPQNYGQNHSVVLKYTSALLNVVKLEWVNPVSPAEKYTITNPSLFNRSVSTEVKGSSSGITTYYDLNVYYIDNSSSFVEHNITIKEISTQPTPTVSPSPTPSPTPVITASPTPIPQIPPIAIITGNDTVHAGESLSISGYDSYARTKGAYVKDYLWEFTQPPDEEDLTYGGGRGSGSVKYNTTGIKTIRLRVKDSNGDTSSFAAKNITVIAPRPQVSMNSVSSVKQFRLFSADFSGSFAPNGCYTGITPLASDYVDKNINWSNSAIWAKKFNESEITEFDQVYFEYYDKNNIRNFGLYTGQVFASVKKVNFISKKTTVTGIKLYGYVTDIAGTKSETLSKIVTVYPDEFPEADLSYPEIVYRTYPSGGAFYFKYDITNLCVSPDGDPFEYIKVYQKYDSDNDGDFGDETLESIGNIDVESNKLWVAKDNFGIGKYQFFIEPREYISPKDTIIEFIYEMDIRKELSQKEQICNHDNIAPSVDFGTERKKTADVFINIGTTDFSQEQINDTINNQLKPFLQGNGINVNINVNFGYEIIGNKIKEIYTIAEPSSYFGTSMKKYLLLTYDGDVYEYSNYLGTKTILKKLSNVKDLRVVSPKQGFWMAQYGNYGAIYGAIALKNDGTVWRWGSNDYNQFCDNAPTNYTPYQMYSNAIKISTNGLDYYDYGLVYLWTVNFSDNTSIEHYNDTRGHYGRITRNTKICSTPLLTEWHNWSSGSQNFYNIYTDSNNKAFANTWQSNNRGTASIFFLKNNMLYTGDDIKILDYKDDPSGTASYFLGSDGIWYGDYVDGKWGYYPIANGVANSYGYMFIDGTIRQASIPLVGQPLVLVPYYYSEPSFDWNGDYTGVYGASLYDFGVDVLNKDLDDYLNSQNSSSENVFVIDINTANRTEDVGNAGNSIKKLNAYFVGVGNTLSKPWIDNVLTLNNSKGEYKNISTVATTFDNLANYILDNTVPPPNNNYLLLNESLDYTANYNDIELDPKNASKWKFTHDPDYFTNTLRPIRDDATGKYSGTPNKLLSGVEISMPINKLDKVGKFEVEYSAQDLSKNHPKFQNYWRWSSTANTTLYVHRRPFAAFDYTATIDSVSGRLIPQFFDNSYDLDHTNIISKGIVERKWQFRLETDLAWSSGQPSFLQMGKKYAMSLEVKDMEGVWSNPFIQTIDTNNLPPDITANPNRFGPTTNEIFITLFASDPEGKINGLRYTVSNSTIKPTTWNVNNTYNPMTSPRSPGVYITQEGEWYLHAEVEDDLGQKTYKMFGPYVIEKLKITNVSLIGYWNHWRGQIDMFGKRMSTEPHRFLAEEKVKISVDTSGYADKVEIRFSPELESMSFTDTYGNLYKFGDRFGYLVTFPQDSTIYLDNTQNINNAYWEYVIPLSPSSKNWEDMRLSSHYWMEVTAWKGSDSVTTIISDIDVTGNVYDLTYVQPLN